jgi:hypothetical protein
MIDNYAKAMELMRKMEAQLPIPIRPTSALFRMLKEQGMQVARDQELQIKSVLYTGDIGGISCEVTPPAERTPVICSLTQVRVDPRHPLAEEIRAYQVERTRRLAQTGGTGKPVSFTVRPRKKRKR